MRIAMRSSLWADDRMVDLELPDEWRSLVLTMAGDSIPPVTDDVRRRAFSGLSTICRGKKEICILFDDLSRPTRAYELMPHILSELGQAGIRDEQVRFICALGTHAAHDNTAFRKKLGDEVLERFPVYNHNPYDNCADLGTTALGTPILVNKEYLSCDLRIGIGSFVPHSFCGYGGGYKIVMPGIAHADSIAHHHGKLLSQSLDFCVSGKHSGNPLLADLREFGSRAALDVKIDVLVNSRAQSVDLRMGKPEDVYEAFLDRARNHYGTRAPGRADIVFVNAYAKGNETTICLALAERLLKEGGGFIVLLCDIPQGQIVHYTMGRFGKDMWGRAGVGVRKKDPRVRKVFLFCRYKDLANSFWLGEPEDLSWHGSLPEIVHILADEYRGRSPDVFIIPDGTIQILAS